MRRHVLVVAGLVIVLSSLNPSPASADGGLSWFAWGQAWFYDTSEGEFVDDAGVIVTDDPSSSFEIKRARFGIKGWASDTWFYHFMFEGAGEKPKLLQAWVEYDWMSELKIRAGQFKHGFGREAFSSASEWRFLNPSYVVGELGGKHVSGGSSFRDQGIMAYGNLKPGHNVNFDYSVFLMNGSGINVKDSDGQKDIVARIGTVFQAGFSAGGTIYVGKDGLSDLGRNGFGIDVGFVKDKFWVMGEYLVSSEEQNGDADDLEKAGFYLAATYKARDALEVGARYDSWDEDADRGDDRITRLTMGISYYLAKANRITVNYEIPSAELDDFDPPPTIIVQFQGSLK